MKKHFFTCIILMHFLGIELIIGQTNYNDIIDNKIFNKTDSIWFVADQSNPEVYYELNQEVITVKLIEESSAEGDNMMQKEIGAKLLRKAKSGYSDYLLPAGNDYFEILKKLKNQKGIEDIVVNSIGKLNSFTPNDDDYSEQWNLIRISMPDVWDYVEVEGNSPIVVAVIDVGVEWSHEDIAFGSDSYSNIFYNTQEDDWTSSTNPSSGNDTDDDSNGYEDDWIGWDFKNDSDYHEDNDVRNTYEEHGTNIAGIISAKTHNDLGVASIGGGINQQGVLIMPIKVGYGNSPDGSVVDDAIYYAINNGADVISMSLQLNTSSAINTAILAAENANISVVAAAGNSNSSSVTYPASNSNVIAIGASDKNDQKASFSNYGSGLFLTAPGVDIYTTKNSNNYGVTEEDGTSFSAPQVAATIALMKMINPLLTNDKIRTILMNNSDKVGGYTYTNGKSAELGYGRLNVIRAIQAVYPLNGLDYICSSGGSFKLDSLPPGVTLTWDKSGNINYASGFGEHSNPCTFEPSSSLLSDGWIEATVSTGNGNAIFTKPVALNGPYYDDVELLMYQGTTLITPLSENIWALDPNTEYILQLDYNNTTGCSLSIIDFNLPGSFTIYGTYSNYVDFKTPNTTDGYSFSVDAQTCCSADQELKNGFLLVGMEMYSLIFTPNPSSDETMVALVEKEEKSEKSSKIDENIEWDMEVYDFNYSLKAKKDKIKGKQQILNVSGWKKGIYIVQAKIDGQVIYGKLAVE